LWSTGDSCRSSDLDFKAKLAGPKREEAAIADAELCKKERRFGFINV
jgi:hypothetical protein